MNHAELQEDLATWLRSQRRPAVVHTEIALAGSWGSAGRLDVVRFTSAKAYREVTLTGFEVKASRADFLADIRVGKWRKYLKPLNLLYFAYPEGLLERGEIPDETGAVIRLKRGGWKFIKKAPRMKDGPTRETLARLVWRSERKAQAYLSGLVS